MLLPRRLLKLSVLSLHTSYTCRVFLVFTCLYTLAVYFARLRCWRDPTSIFFAEDKAYEPAYSAPRAEQANTFLERANNNTLPRHFQSKASAHPTMCVGIASVAREAVSYLPSAVGSVLEGLSATEREDLYLIIFIAHTNPAEHPAYLEPWLHALADRVLLYDFDVLDIDHVRDLETPEEKSGAHEKGLLDYTYLLRACESVNTSYTVMLEDDVVALDGWYHRTKHALAAIEQQTKTLEEGADKWLYLRLFYTEKFLGWNSEEWPIYLFYSLLAVVGVVATTIAIRRCHPATTRYLPNETIALLSFIITPLLIILFFAAGRATMLPIPDGVHIMPKFGCCSQGLVFPQARIKDLVSWYESKRAGYVDMLTEDYADQNGETRWALTPCVLQHVGSKSSKTNSPGRHKNHRTASETIWNFRFEGNDAESLRREHELQKEEEEMNI